MGKSATPVLDRVREILTSAPRTQPSGFPEAYSYAELACRAYETASPTRAQLSSVRRAVAQLVKAGEAERDTDRIALGIFGQRERGHHWRDYGTHGGYYANPAGIEVRRPITDTERLDAVHKLRS